MSNPAGSNSKRGKDPENVVLVLSANDLRSGRVVYLNDSGGWSGSIVDAWKLQGEGDPAEAQSLAMDSENANLIVEPALIEAVCTGRFRPRHFRELIRELGPTCLSHNSAPTALENAHVRV